jgi:hypothetical protein
MARSRSNCHWNGASLLLATSKLTRYGQISDAGAGPFGSARQSPWATRCDSAPPRCLVGELNACGEVELCVDVRQVGLHDTGRDE